MSPVVAVADPTRALEVVNGAHDLARLRRGVASSGKVIVATRGDRSLVRECRAIAQHAGAVLVCTVYTPYDRHPGFLLLPPDCPGCWMCWQIRVAAARSLNSLQTPTGFRGRIPSVDIVLEALRRAENEPACASRPPGEPMILRSFLVRPDCPDCDGGWNRAARRPARRLADRELGPIARGRVVHPPEGVASMLPVVSYRVRNNLLHRGRSESYAWGRGLRLRTAARGARAEAIEEYASTLWADRQLSLPDRRGTAAVSAADANHVAAFRPDGTVEWCETDISRPSVRGWFDDGTPVDLPTRAVFYGAHPVLQHVETSRSRTGVAADRDHANAASAACGELVERYVLAVAWANRVAGRPESAFSRRAVAARYLSAALRSSRCRLDVAGLPNDSRWWVVVARIVSIDGRPPVQSIGAAARRTREAAIDAAITEAAQVRTGLVHLVASQSPRCGNPDGEVARPQTSHQRAVYHAFGHGRGRLDQLFGHSASDRSYRVVSVPRRHACVSLATPDVRACGWHVVRAVLIADHETELDAGTKFEAPFPLA